MFLDGCWAGVGGASFFAGCGRAFQGVDFRKSAVGEVEGESFLLRASAEPVLEGLAGCQAEVPVSVEEKKAFLLANGIAVWDVIASCRIVRVFGQLHPGCGSKRWAGLLQDSGLRRCFATAQSHGSYITGIVRRHVSGKRGSFPTSPANAAWSPERLISWGEALLPYVAPGKDK